MSRARIVCSEILSRMSPVNQYDEKSYINTTPDKVFNLCINESEVFTQNTDCSSVLADISTTMDDWLQPKPTDTTMDCIDAGYLNDDDEHFLSTKDDISHIGLDLVLTKKNSFCGMSDKNTDMDPLLNLMPMNELLLRKTETKCDNLLDNEILKPGRNSMWDTLSIASRRSDCDPENHADFSDFNILSFPFETNDHISDLDALNSDKNTLNCDKTLKNNNIDYDKLQHKKRPNIQKLKKETDPDAPVSNKTVDLLNTFNSSDSDTVFDFPNNHAFVSSGDPEFTILQEELDCTLNFPEPLSEPVLVEEEKRITKRNRVSEIPNSVGMVAIVSNSTVNAKSKTKIVIKTRKGDEWYEGNTAELVEASGTAKKNRLSPIEGEHVITSVKTAANFRCDKKSFETEDRLVKDMLAVLGITNEMLYTLNTNLGLRMWICPENDCRRIFSRLNTLKSHILSHYGLKPFKCDFPECPWSFYTSFKLKRHRDTHLKRKDFKCTVPDCNRTFTTIYNLNTHLKLHERPARLKCLVRTCNSKFQTRRAMEIHLKTHDVPLAPYKCLHLGCNKLYFSCSALTAHSRSHSHTEDELRCQWENCGRLFDKPCRLKAHMRQHTGDKPYVCKYKDCNWAFPSSSKLKRHQYKHNNERKFRCTIGDCTKAFMRSEHLREHTFTHIAQRTFQCTICGEKCSAKATLYVHKKKYHPNETDKNETDTSPTDPVAISTNQIEIESENVTNATEILPVGNLPGLTENSTFLIALMSPGDDANQVNPSPVFIQDVNGQEYELSIPNLTEMNHQFVTIPNEVLPNKEIMRKQRSMSKTVSKNCARTCLPYLEVSQKDDDPCQLISAVENGDSTSDSNNITLSPEMLLGTDLHNNQDTICLSNLMLQDDLGATELYNTEDGTEYILLLDSGANSSFSASTINLKDLD